MIDVKHFKEVNDALGHLAGDQVLIAVARRLTGAADAQDVVCRFGGDEFAVLLPAPGSAEEVAARARRLLASLTDPVEVEGVPLSIEVYAGLALLDPADERPDGTELMRRADVAMHQSKRTGQSLFCYDGVRDPRDRERLELSGQLALGGGRRRVRAALPADRGPGHRRRGGGRGPGPLAPPDPRAVESAGLPRATGALQPPAGLHRVDFA